MDMPATTAIEEKGQFTRYERRGAVAWVWLSRPEYANTQNYRMLDEVDGWFRRATEDPDIRVIVLAGDGKHFSSGHDLGTPDYDKQLPRERKTLWDDHLTKDPQGAERQYVVEQDVYLGLCRRWQDMSKPAIAMVQGACISGGMMLAMACDMIVASDDAFFQDPVVKLGIPSVEYCAHLLELPPRIAREFIYLGQRMPAQRAYDLGMINRVVPRAELEAEVTKIAEEIATRPAFAMTLSKRAVNFIEDLRGKRTAMEGIFHMHHLGHAHNQLMSGGVVVGGAKDLKGE